MDGASAPEGKVQTEYLDADYAVRISCKSMEPTITDGSIVFVKHVNELNEGDVGIFLVDENVMCKCYCLDGGESGCAQTMSLLNSMLSVSRKA